ncbi:hypothetical protein GA0115246_115361, partial [Streptomyces sp. SolWspMP-sol7th]
SATAGDPCRPRRSAYASGTLRTTTGPAPQGVRGPSGRTGSATAPMGAGARGYFFLPLGSSLERTAMKASCGTSTDPTIFMRFFPSFCFSRSFRLREMSPP